MLLFVFLFLEESQFMFEQLHGDGWNIGELKYPLGQGIRKSFLYIRKKVVILDRFRGYKTKSFLYYISHQM